MPFIEIDGKKVEAEAGSMIIEVADSIHVQIPRFCYHKKLSIAANCRMCLVEVERSPKPLPACATPVTEGMKIWTRSPMALLAQKSVMEFLLINHPLDCPICDQGGECELQDLSMGIGRDTSRYTEGKRVVKDKNLGPLISTDMTRCIQCTRCVRFGTEIAGLRELGALGKGECLEIGTFIEQSVVSEVSGNIIDLCPVGALTSKPYRFTARGWELKQTASVSPHDCIGSNLFIHTRQNRVMRVVPKENELINEVWISDRDRYSYEGLYHTERLTQPKLKREGQWHTISWEDALTYTAKRLQEIKESEGATNIGALASPNVTLEEAYLLQKLMRGLGSHNIDHRLRQSDFNDTVQAMAPLFPNMGISLSEIDHQSVVLLIGSAVRQEQPILGLKLRKMRLNGGKILVVNPIDFVFNFEVIEKSIVPDNDFVLGVARIAKAILNIQKKAGAQISKSAEEAVVWLKSVEPLAADINMAEYLIGHVQKNNSDENNTHPNNTHEPIPPFGKGGLGGILHPEVDKKLILLGALAINHPAYSQLVLLSNLIAELTHSKVGILSEGANAAGAWLAGCVPHRLPGGEEIKSEVGLNTAQMWDKKLKAYLLLNMEPDLDCFNGSKAMQTLTSADCVVAITPFESPALLEVADLLLPMAPFSETAGTFVNCEGKWQAFKAAALPMNDSRPAWKILRVLGNLLDLEDFKYESAEESAALVKARTTEMAVPNANNNPNSPLDLAKAFSSIKPFASQDMQNTLTSISPVGLYATDGLVRRAKSLQETLRSKVEMEVEMKDA
ncbi:MAG TPA: NADH-quinone oxidoreductase subunit NuoG [Gammaproteobacteria bacterium]|nr:NADH-quinone oxidoreductase subunit NuoG [Gammaproteobacteria bacterium]